MADYSIVIQAPGPQGPAGNGSVSSSLGWISVKDYGAVGNGSTDDTVSIQAAIDAAVGGSVAAGAGAIRQAVANVYLPPGDYKVTNVLKVYSVTGFQMSGAGGSTIISMSGTTRAYVLDINGVGFGKFNNFAVRGLTGSDIVTTAAIGLNWDDSTSAGSCYAVRLENLWVRNLKYVHGIDIGGSSSTRQVSEITVTQCTVAGQDFDDATYWKTGIRCGSGTAGNILNHWITDCSVMAHQYNVWNNSVHNVAVTGLDTGHAESDLRQTGDSVFSVTGVRSETSQRLFIEDGGAGYNSNISLSDINWEPDGIHSDKRFIKFGYSGPKTLTNVTLTYNVTGVPLIYVANSGTKSAQITAIGLRLPVAIGSVWDISGSAPASIVAINYTQTSTGDGSENGINPLWIKQYNNAGDLPVVNGDVIRPYLADSDSMVAGQFTPRRRDWNSTGVSMNVAGSGDMFVTMFTADKTESINTVTTYTGGTAAAATPTICRVGIYSVADNGDLTLLNSSTNDTAMWSATFTTYAKALSTTFNKVAGVRYAVAAICVTGGALPVLHGNIGPGTGIMNGIAKELPVIQGVVVTQTNLPSSVSYGNGSYFGFGAAIGFKLS